MSQAFIFVSKKFLGFKLFGVLTDNKASNDIVSFCDEKSIKVFKDLSDFLKNGECDIAISVQFNQILKKKHIEKQQNFLSICIWLRYLITGGAISFLCIN